MEVSLLQWSRVERTEEMSRNYYHRVSNFAKEMLISPSNLHVHRNSMGVFHNSPRTNVETSFRQEQPMNFGANFKTNSERVAE